MAFVRREDWPLLNSDHVRSWLKAHPEARPGPSGDWELPRATTDADTIAALRDIVLDTLDGAKVKDSQILAACIVADVMGNFDVRLMDPGDETEPGVERTP
jgi:hypothetical protein